MDLESQGYPVLKITQMNGNVKNPTLLVLVEIDRKYNSIYKINAIGNLQVTVEPLKSSGSIIQ